MTSIKEINEAIFELYGRIYANKKFLTDKQYKFFCSCLFSQYQIEYRKYFLEKNIIDKTEIFNLKKKSKFHIPFSFLFFSNKIARKFVKNIKKDFESYFATLGTSEVEGQSEDVEQ